MGQAAIDLPNSDQAPAPMTSADDLLSQLAGDEIDRLLAEADGNAPGDPAAVEPLELEPELQPDEQPQPIASASAQQSPEPQEGVDQEVDELFRQIEAGPLERAASPASDISGSATLPISASPELEQSTTAAERAALQPPVEIFTNPLPSRWVYLHTAVPVRILELVNSPVRSIPDSARNLMGKAAIFTLANSVALLLYAFLFRK